MSLREVYFASSGYMYFSFCLFLFAILFRSLAQHRKKVLEISPAHFFGEDLLFQRRRFWIKSILQLGTCFFLLLTLMEPRGNPHYLGISENEQVLKPHEVLFVIDASASMSIRDARSGKSRLEYAKETAEQILNILEGENASLYAFTSQILPLSPSTLDYTFVLLMLNQIEINEGNTVGTDLLQALQAVVDRFQKLSFEELKTVIFLTDGDDTDLNQEKEQKILTLADSSGNLNYRLFTVGIGSTSGEKVPGVVYKGADVTSKLNEELLTRLSLHGRGKYYSTNQMNSINIAGDLMKFMKSRYEREGIVSARTLDFLEYDSYFQIPLSLAIICLFLSSMISETSSQPLCHLVRRF